MDQIKFPLILPVPRPQGQAVIEALTQAGVLCELVAAPPILGALKAPDESGWQQFETVPQTDMVGIRVMPDLQTGVRWSQEALEVLIDAVIRA